MGLGAVAFKVWISEEAQASASAPSLGIHSGKQVLQPPHEENLWMHACWVEGPSVAFASYSIQEGFLPRIVQAS